MGFSVVNTEVVIVAGDTYVDVPHGLSYTPNENCILITPKTDLAGISYKRSTVDGTNVRVEIGSIMGEDIYFGVSVVTSIAERTFSASAQTASSFGRGFTGVRTLPNNTVSAASSFARVYSGLRSITASVFTSSTFSRAAAYLRSISASATAASAFTRLFNGARAITSAVTASSTFTRMYSGIRNITASVTASSTFSRMYHAIRSITVGTTASATLTRAFNGTRSVTAAVAASSGFTRLYNGARSLLLANTQVTASMTAYQLIHRIRIALTDKEPITITETD